MPYQTWVDNDATKPLSAARMNSIQNTLPSINVKDPALAGGGAKGDGTTDDSAAINAAINALATAGGTVYFPVGRYLCKLPIILSNRRFIRLLGEGGVAVFNNGVGATRILMHATQFTGQKLVIVDGDPSKTGALMHEGPIFEYLVFEDLNGPSTVGSYGARPPRSLLYFHSVNFVTIRNCVFMAAEKAIEIAPKDHPSEDNAWYAIIKCHFRFNKYSIWGAPQAAEVYSSSMFATDDGVCVYLLDGSTWFSMFGCKLEGQNAASNLSVGVQTAVGYLTNALEFYNTKMEGLKTGFLFQGGRGIKIFGGTFTGYANIVNKTGIDIGPDVNRAAAAPGGAPRGQGVFISGISFENMGGSTNTCVKDGAIETQYYGPWTGYNVGLQPMIIRAPGQPIGTNLAQAGTLWINTNGGVNSSLYVNQAGTSQSPAGVWKNLG
jgi:hypothetical protein